MAHSSNPEKCKSTFFLNISIASIIDPLVKEITLCDDNSQAFHSFSVKPILLEPSTSTLLSGKLLGILIIISITWSSMVKLDFISLITLLILIFIISVINLDLFSSTPLVICLISKADMFLVVNFSMSCFNWIFLNWLYQDWTSLPKYLHAK